MIMIPTTTKKDKHKSKNQNLPNHVISKLSESADNINQPITELQSINPFFSPNLVKSLIAKGEKIE